MHEFSSRITEVSSDRVTMLVADPPPDLAPLLSGYYCTRIVGDGMLEEWMPPEEANMRTGIADHYAAVIGPGEPRAVPPVILSGPTDRGTHAQVSAGDYWGVGLTPAGWARVVDMPASDFANRFDDMANYPALASLHSMFLTVANGGLDDFAVIALFNRTFRAQIGERRQDEGTIHALHLAIASGKAIPTEQLASMAGMNVRAIERFCKRHFGFPPGVLQRRQRFLRSLGRYMMDPSMRWIESLDSHYTDQAHFIRDFRNIMGMTPGQYAKRPHPVVSAAVKATSKAAGVAMQALHTPPPG